jgi:hypothetical protein
MESNTYITKVVPTIGEFKVVINKWHDRNNKNKIVDCTLNIGGNDDKCINITIPTDISNTSLLLSWAETDKKCTLDSLKIKGNSTQIMLQLAITIAREISPHVREILLDDMSHFYCMTQDGPIKTHLPSFYIAFNGKTWYEDKFGAVMIDSQYYEKYKKCLRNFYDPSYKNPNFDFINKDLQSMLKPLYQNSHCWKDFFDQISEIYKDKKCEIIYPWIKHAMRILFDGQKLWDIVEWKIPINEKNTPKIKYYEYSLQQNESIKVPIINPYKETDVNYNQVMSWKFNKTPKIKRRKTRKNRY